MAVESRLPRGGLYALTPDRSDTEQLVREVHACLEGGAALVQYRTKSADGALALTQARRLAALCRAHGTPFIVNDSLALALAVGADGVHLGREDGDIAQARRAFAGILGVSCYDDAARARAAGALGANYVAIGSVFASGTKPTAVRAPLARLAEAKAASGLPVVAIGGITAINAAEAVAAGADFVAAIDALFGAEDIRAAAQALTNAVSSTRSRSHV